MARNAFSFTNASVRGVEPSANEEWYSDSHRDAPSGFKLRVSPNGGKRFVLIARIKGNSRKLTIGKFPDLNVLDARNAAKIQIAKIVSGEDPRTIKKREKAQGLTLRSAIHDHICLLYTSPSPRD